MELTVEQLDESTKLIKLVGRMDIQGADQVDLPLTRATSFEKGGVIVDLSGVDFMASIGLRTLMTCSKTVGMKGGKLVLLSPQAAVSEVLKTTKIDTVIEIFDDLEEAKKAVAA